MRKKSSTPVKFSFILTALFLTACQNAGGPQLKIANAWGRPSPNSAMMTALYMEIQNTGNQADELIAASSPACGVIELHETVMADDVMTMRPVPDGTIQIQAGETVVLETGGLHLMCIDKQADFAVGETIPVTLQFEVSGEMKLEVEVRNP